MTERNDFHLFIQENGTFILSFFSVLVLIFCLKSRCSSVKCCGLEISRIPIPVEQLNNVNLELPNDPNPVFNEEIP